MEERKFNSALEKEKWLENRIEELENIIRSEKILLVEDGSVDLDTLKHDGFYVVVYRQGSIPPYFLK